MAEMAVFGCLIFPLPFTLKRKLFTFISESPIVAKLQYGLKVRTWQRIPVCRPVLTETVTDLDHFHLHPDSFHRQRQPSLSCSAGGVIFQGRRCLIVSIPSPPHPHPSKDFQATVLTTLPLFANSRAAAIGSDRLEVQARKFYSQRNMYLCGFTLFLSLILNRTYIMILELLRLEDKVKHLEGGKKGGKDSARLAEAGDVGEIGRLKKELAAKDRDIETLKKQSEGLSREYHNLGDQVAGKSDDSAKKDL